MREAAASALQAASGWLVVFLLFQIALGAFVAGSRAGLTYNTWPLMDGALMPAWSAMTSMEPGWRNFFENHATVQFQHRMGAYLLLAFAVWHAWTARSVAPGSKAAKRAARHRRPHPVSGGDRHRHASVRSNGEIPLSWGLAHQGFADRGAGHGDSTLAGARGALNS